MRSKRVQKKNVTMWQKAIITLLVVIAILALTELFLVVRAGYKLHHLGLLDWQIEKARELSDEAENELESDEIMYKGKKYKLNDELITILVLGIDSKNYAKKVTGENCGNQSDANFLLLLDGKKDEIRVIAISRDTMTKIKTYDVKGEPIGENEAQLALQYAYGDGDKGSCELTKEAVSHLMYGVPINLYSSINYGAIPLINDAVGGVNMKMPSDLPNLGFRKDQTVTLNGWQASTLVRSRDAAKLGSNDDRMLLQKTYLMSFLVSMKSKIKEDVTVSVDLYKAINPYMVTDITQDKLVYLAGSSKDYSFSKDNFVNAPGSNEEGEFHDQFVSDDEALKDLVVSNFYVKCKDKK